MYQVIFHSIPINLSPISWLNGKESFCQCRRCRRHEFHPWVWKIPWRKNWQSTPGFLSGKFHGQRSLAGCSAWGCKKSDNGVTEHAHHTHNLKTELIQCRFQSIKQWYPLSERIRLYPSLAKKNLIIIMS